ncbi:MAG: YqeG family HAD IIIA-type phosphatase [Clostridiaceae bacterium]|nr:YqeG family HAD IIIA-type phosphatase [Clostridiaceae bacterium]
MMEKLYPDMKVDRIQDIDLYNLSRNNIKGLILDIDNTLVPEHVEEADENAIEWIMDVKRAGFKVCIVSNASKKRVVKFNEKLKVHALHRASKPGTESFLKAALLMEIKPEETAVIGDQIFTDIYGGNRANMFTVLVKPLDEREFFFVRMKRIVEKFVLASHEKRYLKKSKN